MNVMENTRQAIANESAGKEEYLQMALTSRIDGIVVPVLANATNRALPIQLMGFRLRPMANANLAKIRRRHHRGSGSTSVCIPKPILNTWLT